MCKSIKISFIIIFCLAIAVLAFFVAFKTTDVAFAEGNGYYYLKQTTQSKTAVSSSMEFKNADGTSLFKIPETYYVKIEEINSDSISVSYMGLAGTIKKVEGLTPVTTTAISNVAITENNAYPVIELKPTGDQIAYTNMNDVETSVDSNIVKVYFMGEAMDGANIYVKFVTDDNSFYGYANKSIFESFSISSNQEVIDAINNANASPMSKATNTNNSKALRVILIIGLIIPAIVIALLIFIPRKSEQYDKARMHGKKTSFIDYDKTRSPEQDPNNAQAPQGYIQPNQPQYPAQNYNPPQNNGYYPPQQPQQPYYPSQNNGYYPPQQPQQPYYPPQGPQYPYQQQGYYPPQDNNGYPPYDDGNNGQY